MYALGGEDLPATIEIAGRRYHLERTVKHDFWAATGFYQPGDGLGGEASRIVVKINRRGFPFRWTGRKLQRREMRAYTKLQDLPNVPALLGPVGDTGFAHAYVAGEPLNKGATVPDTFFPELLALVGHLRDRGIAYVDTNKPENVLLGDDGRPHLIDFQISCDASAWWPRWVGQRVLASCYHGDIYHVLKLKRRFRPDQLTDADRKRLEQRGWVIRTHRFLTKPYFAVRRPLMRWLMRKGWIEPELSK